MLNLKAKFESGLSYFSFKRFSSRRFQSGFDRVNLHRLTKDSFLSLRQRSLRVRLRPGADARPLCGST